MFLSESEYDILQLVQASGHEKKNKASWMVEFRKVYYHAKFSWLDIEDTEDQTAQRLKSNSV